MLHNKFRAFSRFPFCVSHGSFSNESIPKNPKDHERLRLDFFSSELLQRKEKFLEMFEIR